MYLHVRFWMWPVKYPSVCTWLCQRWHVTVVDHIYMYMYVLVSDAVCKNSQRNHSQSNQNWNSNFLPFWIFSWQDFKELKVYIDTQCKPFVKYTQYGYTVIGYSSLIPRFAKGSMAQVLSFTIKCTLSAYCMSVLNTFITIKGFNPFASEAVYTPAIFFLTWSVPACRNPYQGIVL